MILQFPVQGRASLKANSRRPREANEANVFAFNPAALAAAVASTASHHSEGMLSRCHHLLTDDAVAPMSDAIASRVGQSSITERNDANSIMRIGVRQSVLNCKAIVSDDCGEHIGHNVLMGEKATASFYRAAFLGRVKAARELRFSRQEDAAVALGMHQTKYGKYESRSLMPHILIEQFCKVCGVTAQWLMIAEGPGPKWQPVYPSNKTRKKRAKKVKKAA